MIFSQSEWKEQLIDEQVWSSKGVGVEVNSDIM